MNDSLYITYNWGRGGADGRPAGVTRLVISGSYVLYPSRPALHHCSTTEVEENISSGAQK